VGVAVARCGNSRASKGSDSESGAHVDNVDLFV
jgi:hypothetical protein